MNEGSFTWNNKINDTMILFMTKRFQHKNTAELLETGSFIAWLAKDDRRELCVCVLMMCGMMTDGERR